ncbi:MAG: class I SAM-dependent methyltransferase, partial [Conexivisphaerales archaeon]
IIKNVFKLLEIISKMWREITKCRVCGSSDLDEVLSLGMQVVKDFLDSPNDSSKRGPLDLVLCNKCGLLQLKHTFSKEYLYTHYWYRSSTSQTMVKELSNIVESASRCVNLNTGDTVIDIGANDGTLLRQYKDTSLNRIGYEPSNLWQYGVTSGAVIINDYFSSKSFLEKFPGRKAKIVTSIAMFYDLDDPNKFTSDVKSVLHPEGVWVIQMNYLGLMVKNLGYDNICHEHVGYYGLTSMQYLLERHNLQVFDIELNNVNGGSFRLYVKHAEDDTKKINIQAIEKIRKKETQMHLSEKHTYSVFAEAINKQKQELNQLLDEISENGKKIIIYGASTRGLVILEYCGIDSNRIRYATDKNSDKWGKYLSGTGIKIISLEDYRKMQPDYLLVLPYQYANEIAYQEKTFMDKGGKLIIPLPVPKILDKNYFFNANKNNRNKFLSGYDRL